MKVFVNNREYLMDTQFTVVQMLSFLKINDLKGIAVAVNNEVIPKLHWENHTLKDGDNIVLIKAAQGG